MYIHIRKFYFMLMLAALSKIKYNFIYKEMITYSYLDLYMYAYKIQIHLHI